MTLSVDNELVACKTDENPYSRLYFHCIQENIHLLEALNSIILLLTFNL